MKQALGLAWLPILFLYTLGSSGAPALPIWLPGLSARFGLTPAQSGLIGSLELGCLALSSIIWAMVPIARRHRRWVLAAIVAGIGGNILSYSAESATMLIAGRVVVGLSFGLTIAEITGIVARMSDSHRIFSRQQFGLVIFIAAFFATVPMVAQLVGPTAPFLYMGGLGVLALLTLGWLPAPQTSHEPTAKVEMGAPAAPRSIVVGTMLVAMGLTYMTQTSLFTYIADLAKNADIPLPLLGRILAIGAILNFGAPIAAERLGLRFGRTLPFAIGYFGLALSILLISSGLSATVFTIGLFGLNLFLLFVTPFMFGTLASLDPSGRSASAGPAFLTVGAAIGPTLGGVVIGSAGYAALGSLLAVVEGIALILTLFVISRISSASGAPAEAKS